MCAHTYGGKRTSKVRILENYENTHYFFLRNNVVPLFKSLYIKKSKRNWVILTLLALDKTILNCPKVNADTNSLFFVYLSLKTIFELNVWFVRLRNNSCTIQMLWVQQSIKKIHLKKSLLARCTAAMLNIKVRNLSEVLGLIPYLKSPVATDACIWFHYRTWAHFLPLQRVTY